MRGVDGEGPERAVSMPRRMPVEPRRELLHDHEDAIVEQRDRPAIVGDLTAIVNQRGAQQQWIIVAAAHKRLVDIEAVALVEPRHALEQPQLAVAEKLADEIALIMREP